MNDQDANAAAAGAHRQLGRELGLFTTDPSVGSGLPLWLPRGAAVRSSLERFITDVERRAGYQHVYTPALAKRELYERSGHWAHYRDDMFPPMHLGEEELVLRPMNCPHHVLVFQSEERSWRDLPVRIAELATMYRDERSGVVGGLHRVRAMTLNDGHVFCRRDQLHTEFVAMIGMIERSYAALGIDGHRYRLSLGRAGDPKFVDNPQLWSSAEEALRDVLSDLDIDHDVAEGEAAFYGPKIDVQVRDRLGRESTLSTVQLDFYLPEVFGLEYVGADGQRHTPVMIHRSVVSTMERMVGHLLDQHGARLPLWLSPVHAVVLPVAAAQVDAAAALRDELVDVGVRAEVDARDHTLAGRIRDAQLRQAPCMAVVGDTEVADGTVAVRLRNGHKASIARAAFTARLAAVVAGYAVDAPDDLVDAGPAGLVELA